jgi:hypothetical protein
VQQKKCDRKITAEKVRQKDRGRKSVTKRSRQKNCDRNIAAEKVW